MSDPYQAPATETVDQLPPRSSVAAALIGGLVVDLLGTTVILAIVTVMFLSSVGGGGAATEAEIELATSSTTFLGLSSVIGLAMTFAGGFAAARWARRRGLFHGAAAGCVSLLVALPFVFVSGLGDPAWLNLALLVVHIPIAAGGGFVAGPRD